MTSEKPQNTLIVLATLWASRPGPAAPVERVAAWYEAKGRAHELLAGQTSSDAERAEALANAAGAYEHARRLLLACSPRPVGAEAEAVVLTERADQVGQAVVVPAPRAAHPLVRAVAS